MSNTICLTQVLFNKRESGSLLIMARHRTRVRAPLLGVEESAKDALLVDEGAELAPHLADKQVKHAGGQVAGRHYIILYHIML